MSRIDPDSPHTLGPPQDPAKPRRGGARTERSGADDPPLTTATVTILLAQILERLDRADERGEEMANQLDDLHAEWSSDPPGADEPEDEFEG